VLFFVALNDTPYDAMRGSAAMTAPWCSSSRPLGPLPAASHCASMLRNVHTAMRLPPRIDLISPLSHCETVESVVGTARARSAAVFFRMSSACCRRAASVFIG
jgi:hypothetical protein